MEADMLGSIWPEWQIVKEIGSGSYGKVYEAVRRGYSVESRAAIKVIQVPQNNSEIVNDFVREIELMESFRGAQNIVNVEDFKAAEKPDGTGWVIFIRMELLTPLNAYLCDKVLSEPDVIKLGADICTALELYAGRNAVHRNIKPENIFINRSGDYKLGDFGIARKPESVTGGLSQEDTYSYMAPEAEKENRYGARADLYSLGLVLYRLLNKNRLPFLNTERQLLDTNERMAAIRRRMEGEPLPPPCDASPDMAQVILCACSHDPGRRFISATALKNALAGIRNKFYRTNAEGLNGAVPVRHAAQAQNPNPTSAARKSPQKQTPAPKQADTAGGKKKSKAPAIIAAVLAIALLAGGGFFVLPRFLRDADSSRETDNTADELSHEADGVYSDFDEGRIASIIEDAELLAQAEDYEGALEKIKTALTKYPKSMALQEKELEYTKAYSAQIQMSIADGTDAVQPEPGSPEDSQQPESGSPENAQAPETPPPAQETPAPVQTQSPDYKDEPENWEYATIASADDNTVEALVLQELTGDGKWSKYFDGTNSDVWLKSYPNKYCRVRQKTTITSGRGFELFVTNNANAYRSRTGASDQDMTTLDMAIEEYAKNSFDHIYAELKWLGEPVYDETIEDINGNSWYVYSGYSSGKGNQNFYWIFFFIDEDREIAVDVSFEYVLYNGASLADAAFFNEWYLNLSESLLIR